MARTAYVTALEALLNWDFHSTDANVIRQSALAAKRQATVCMRVRLAAGFLPPEIEQITQ